MMQKFYMQEKVFGILTDFYVKNQQGYDCYIIYSKLFSLAQKQQLLNAQTHQELLSVEDKLFSWSPIYYVKQNDEVIFMIKDECKCMSQELTITEQLIGRYSAISTNIIFKYLKTARQQLQQLRQSIHGEILTQLKCLTHNQNM
ncbi:LURP-one-related_family protein [Hexamita inflata]|uniref:LURP-one-related family protein n=1 Tax=Hexamita inflata TaxID=28002 RepID=A0AA86V063_9EUKA|nr:LURP-one-related family protein [Hexamita inflata]